jgi:heme/copper-type cytochrome/quinol oxidase subunit 2
VFYLAVMDKISLAILWFFVFIRAIIFFGIVYFVTIEFRKYKKRREENGERDKEDSRD